MASGFGEKNAPAEPTQNHKNLWELTQAINSRTSGVPGAGSAHERFFGRKPLLHLPSLPKQLTPEQKASMSQKMSKHRDKYHMKNRNTRLENYNIDNPVLVFDPRLKSFLKEAKVVSYDPHPLQYIGTSWLHSRIQGGGDNEDESAVAYKVPCLSHCLEYVYFGLES